jgi:hypothetical protein
MEFSMRPVAIYKYMGTFMLIMLATFKQKID